MARERLSVRNLPRSIIRCYSHTISTRRGPQSSYSHQIAMNVCTDFLFAQYIQGSGTSARLTDSLLTVIRQQRHFATRVVISTQEPTVVPTKFLDLCSIIIAHRFSSPEWLHLLSRHISAADSMADGLFQKVGQGLFHVLQLD